MLVACQLARETLTLRRRKFTVDERDTHALCNPDPHPAAYPTTQSTNFSGRHAGEGRSFVCLVDRFDTAGRVDSAAEGARQRLPSNFVRGICMVCMMCMCMGCYG